MNLSILLRLRGLACKLKLSIILESTQNGIEVNGPTSKQGKTTFFSVIFDDQVIDCIEPLNLFGKVDN